MSNGAQSSPARSLQQRSLAPLWIVLAALCAISPLLLQGVSCGHDLSFHLLNWMEVASQWRHGVLRPFWCFHAAWAAGEPRFVFYPPMSWSVGAVLGTVLPWQMTPVAYTFMVLAACGLTMRRFLQDLVSPAAATTGACLYLANPYALFTAFERTAYAELLAAAWIPLLLRAVFASRMRALQLALPVALLWLTNAPAAVAASYALLVLGTVRCAFAWREQGTNAMLANVREMVCGYALGLSLAGFFLLPAIVQRHLVQIDMAVLPGMRPRDNFLFGRTGEALHDLVLHQASILAVCLIAVALAAAALLLWRLTRHRAWKSMHDLQTSQRTERTLPKQVAVLSLGLLSLVVLFLLTPASAAVWRYAPELGFLQFPWRFLVVITAAAGTLVAMLMPAGLRSTHAAVIALVFACLAGWATHALYAQICEDEDTPPAQRAIFEQGKGSEPTDEYTPTAADNDALKQNLPTAWLAGNEDDGPSPSTEVITVEGGRPDRLNFVTRPSSHNGYLVVRLRQFAGWRVIVDDVEQTPHSQRNDGLLAIPLAPGAHTVQVRYRWTWDESAGLLLSSLGAGVALLLGRKQRYLTPAQAA